jgi:hypothetical protein
VKTGVQGISNYSRTLDSGFRRNDGKRRLRTFYEIIRYVIVKTTGRVFCQDMPELTKAKNGEKKCPGRKSRKREDSDGFIKEIALLQRPRRSSKKRQSQSIPDWKHRYPSKVVA